MSLFYGVRRAGGTSRESTSGYVRLSYLGYLGKCRSTFCFSLSTGTEKPSSTRRIRSIRPLRYQEEEEDDAPSHSSDELVGVRFAELEAAPVLHSVHLLSQRLLNLSLLHVSPRLHVLRKYGNGGSFPNSDPILNCTVVSIDVYYKFNDVTSHGTRL